MKKSSKQPKETKSRSSLWLGVAVLAVVLSGAFVAFRYFSPAPKEVPVAEAPSGAETKGVPVVPTINTVIDQGVAVTFSIKPLATQPELTEISFAVTDSSNGQPIALDAPPLVWIGSQQAQVLDTQGKELLSCQDKIKLYIQGTLDYRPEIDLNSYFLLTLNKDPSISVIDPLGGVTGISQLYAMVELKSPGEDWVMSADGKKLFVTMPKENQVAVVDTENFTVLKYLDAGKSPTRIALQPDGRYVWVANDTDSLSSAGITVIDVASLTVVDTLPTGTGQHEITFSGEVLNLHDHGGQPAAATPESTDKTIFAFISNEQGTVSVIDTKTLDFLASVDVGNKLTSLDYSSASNLIYVAIQDSSNLTLIDASTHEIVGQVTDMATEIAALRFAPGGRWGFALSPTQNRVDIIDATTNKIVHTLTVAGKPDKVSFTAGYAYIHTAEKPEVALIDLNQVGQVGALSPVNVIGGQTAPDQADAALSVADAIISVHEHGGHVLITNPGDQSIYYYMEGMNAPMGSFQTYSRTPRAVRVVDRSIQPTAPGVYSAIVKIPRADKYEAAMMLDAPRIQQCFSFETTTEAVAPQDNQPKIQKPALEFVTTDRTVKKGEHLLFRFKLTDAETQEPIADLTDLYALATLVSGQRSDRFKPTSLGAGLYETDLVFTEAGIYKVYVGIPSLQVQVDDLPFVTMRVTDN